MPSFQVSISILLLKQILMDCLGYEPQLSHFEQPGSIQDLRFFEGDLISPWKYSMIRKKNSIKTPTNLETWRGTHINSLTRFRPDFHHVGGEIKSGCDYKKSLPVVSKEGWPPFISLSYALHWKMILHISTLIIGWVDFGDFFFCRITFYSMMGHFFFQTIFSIKKKED